MTTAQLLASIRATGPAAVARGSALDGAQPALITGLLKLHAYAATLGITFRVADFGGLRTKEQTDKILEYRVDDWAVAIRKDPTLPQRTTIERWRKISPWGNSLHNYGAATDLEIVSVPAGMTRARALQLLRKHAPTVGLVVIAGDDPHFQLPGGLAAQRLRYYAQTGHKFFAGFTTAEILGVLVAFALLLLLILNRR